MASGWSGRTSRCRSTRVTGGEAERLGDGARRVLDPASDHCRASSACSRSCRGSSRGRRNLERSAHAYRTTAIAVVLFLGVAQAVVVLASLGDTLPMVAIVGLGIGTLFIVMGNVLATARSTFLFGVRTPWTLSSERAWDRTNRLVGRLFVLAGLTLVALTLAGNAELIVWVMVAWIGGDPGDLVRVLLPGLEGGSRPADGSGRRSGTRARRMSIGLDQLDPRHRAPHRAARAARAGAAHRRDRRPAARRPGRPRRQQGPVGGGHRARQRDRADPVLPRRPRRRPAAEARRPRPDAVPGWGSPHDPPVAAAASVGARRRTGRAPASPAPPAGGAGCERVPPSIPAPRPRSDRAASPAATRAGSSRSTG